MRLAAVTGGIPPILWYVVVIGAAINILLIWMLDMRLITHLFFGGLIAFFLATLIALVAAMDNPFRGEVSVTADAFESVYKLLMTGKGIPTAGRSDVSLYNPVVKKPGAEPKMVRRPPGD
jgi:hypothetical protein